MNKKYYNFPKGKVNEGEEGHICAVREVWEEIGLDIRELVNPDCYIQYSVKKENKTMFVVVGVNEHYQFKPNNTTRNEIGTIVWKSLKEFDSRRNEEKFYLIKHFLDPLMLFIEHYKKKFRATRKASLDSQTAALATEKSQLISANVEEFFRNEDKLQQLQAETRDHQPDAALHLKDADLLVSEEDDGIIIKVKSRGSLASCPDASGGEDEEDPVEKKSTLTEGKNKEDIMVRLDRRLQMFCEEIEKKAVQVCAALSGICEAKPPDAISLGPNPFKEPISLLDALQ